MKAFGDMGNTARLRFLRDRFIARQDSCALRWHLDSVAPETPIQDIVDRCRVWESHADSIDGRGGNPDLIGLSLSIWWRTWAKLGITYPWQP